MANRVMLHIFVREHGIQELPTNSQFKYLVSWHCLNIRYKTFNGEKYPTILAGLKSLS